MSQKYPDTRTENLVETHHGKTIPDPYRWMEDLDSDEILAWIDDVVDDLGSRREIEYAYTILSEGTSADRQLAMFRQSQDLRAVVDRVVEETQEGIA